MTDDYPTPQIVYDYILEKYNIPKAAMFDPFPYQAKKKDGFRIPWSPLNYINGPFSKKEEIITKAIFEATLGKVSICLFPVHSDRPWFHKLLDLGYEMDFLKFRIKFEGAKWNSPDRFMLVWIK